MEDPQLWSQNPTEQAWKKADFWQQYECLGSRLTSHDWMVRDYFIPYHSWTACASKEAQVQNAYLVDLLDFDPPAFYK